MSQGAKAAKPSQPGGGLGGWRDAASGDANAKKILRYLAP